VLPHIYGYSYKASCARAYKLSFVFFDMRTFWRSALSFRVPRCQKYKWRLNPSGSGHRMLYSCTHVVTVGVTGLYLRRWKYRSIFYIQIFVLSSERCMCFETKCTNHNGPSRSSKVVDFGISRKRVWDWFSKVTLVLLQRIRYITVILYTESHIFPHLTPISAKISVCSLWSRSVMLRSVDSEHTRLSNREIIFE